MEFIQSYEEFDKYYMSNLNEFDDSINSELHHENYYIKSYQSLILPNIYNKIDNKEFMYIQIEKLDLSKNTNLTNIGKYAFATCNIKELKLPLGIETISCYDFEKNKIQQLDLSKCYKLKNIENFSFGSNLLVDIKFPNEIECISENAFFYNNIEYLNFLNCKFLQKIKRNAFSENYLLKEIKILKNIELEYDDMYSIKFHSIL